jgi:hypothetical protein
MDSYGPFTPAISLQFLFSSAIFSTFCTVLTAWLKEKIALEVATKIAGVKLAVIDDTICFIILRTILVTGLHEYSLQTCQEKSLSHPTIHLLIYIFCCTHAFVIPIDMQYRN